MSEVTVHHGDSRDVLKTLADCSIDSVVCDPPYALVSIGKRFGKPGSAAARSNGASGVYARASAGFMGQQWDVGETAFAVEFWAEVYRVLKPGAHVVAFSGTRTYHRLACAIEDAGFEIRDQIGWLYGSGFPKSHDVSKAIDKHLGHERTKVRHKPRAATSGTMAGSSDSRPWIEKAREAGFHEAASQEAASQEAASQEAANWSGWGTALKPAWEPICVARKPLDGTVAANVLQHGTGALNVDGCRIASSEPIAVMSSTGGRKFEQSHNQPDRKNKAVGFQTDGRWPANVVHDGSPEVLAAFPDAPGQQRTVTGEEKSSPFANVYGDMPERNGRAEPRDDGGSAARFFYAVEPDDLCDLCSCPSETISAKLSPCNANAAEPSSPTESTPTGDTALSGVAGSQPPAREAKNRASKGPATTAENLSSRRRRTVSYTAAGPAQTPPPSSLVRSVRSAASLCGSCATAIAQSLVATRHGRSPASLPCPAFIAERSWQILTSNLALYVAQREHTDTITTTESLKTLLGSVLHAIADTTNSARVGSAANTGPGQKRFHYSSKADAEDRIGSKHPTVKPVDLMQWLCRLVTPPGGLLLDPFAGSGSTGLAAMNEGFDCILIERDERFVADINRRIAWARGEGRLTALEMARDVDHVSAAGLDTPLFAANSPASQPASQPASRLRDLRPRRRIGPTGMKRW